MSRIRADRVTNKEGTGAPLFPNGIRVVGLTSISNIAASTGTFTGNVSIGGTLTYEDVTNVDSVGVITARSGIVATGVVTATSFKGDGSLLTGIDATSLKDSSDNIIAQATSTGIGIGTVTPANLLEIQGANGAGGLRLTETNHTNLNRHGRIFEYAGGLYFQSRNDTANGDFIFRGGLDGVEKLRIGSSSQIGIGGANYGTSGQVLTSGGASAAPQWATPAGGAWEFISSISNPNTSTVDFTGFTTAYVAYKVHFNGCNINSTNNREMRCRIYLGGSLQTGNNYRHMMTYNANGTNNPTGYAGLYSAISISGAGDPSQGYNGELTFPMKERTSGNESSLQAFYGFCVSYSYANSVRGFHEGSYSSLLTGIQFGSPDPYNITDGQFYLYGLKRS